jgi:predicted permease
LYLQRIDLGFDPDAVLTSHVMVPQGPGVTPEEQSAFVRQAVERIQAIPGVASAGATSHLPVGGSDFGFYFFREGDLSRGVGRDPVISVRMITPDYFRAIGIPIRRGRPFSAADRSSGVPVAIVSESMAQRYWGGDAIGHRLANSRDRIFREIVGVAGNVRFGGPEADIREELYLPIDQRPWPGVTLVVRAAGQPGTVAGAVRSTLQSPELGRLETDVVPLTRLIDQAIARPRFTASLSNAFAAAALVLAISGVYAVVALFVRERTREIAMRVALGARPGQILALVLHQSVRLASIGITAGAAGSLVAARILDALVPGTGGSIATTIGGGVAMLLVVSVATYFPTRHALGLDAAQALRG